MSIELELLERVQLATGCVEKLTVPVPDNCDAFAHILGAMAQYHFITWFVVLFFFLMLFIGSTFVLNK